MPRSWASAAPPLALPPTLPVVPVLPVPMLLPVLPLPMLLPVPLLVLPLPRLLPVPLLVPPLPMLLPVPLLVLPLPMLLPVPLLLVLPLPMLLPELLLVLPLVDESDDPLEVPLPLSPPDVVPAPVPGEPALPLMRPLAFGCRLASLLVPGEVIVEPPLLAPPPTPEPEPGEALGLDDSLACACWLHASKSAWVCPETCAGAQTRTAAVPSSAVARVTFAMKISS
jgi:hypothetical protein